MNVAPRNNPVNIRLTDADRALLARLVGELDIPGAVLLRTALREFGARHPPASKKRLVPTQASDPAALETPGAAANPNPRG